MVYGYRVVDGKVYVTPIVYRCLDCGFETTDKQEEEKHYYGQGHYLESTLPSDRTEEWEKEKHGALPGWIKILA